MIQFLITRTREGVLDHEIFWFFSWHSLSCGLKIMEQEGWEIISYLKLPD